MAVSRKYISVQDVSQAIREIYRQGYKFGQNFVYVRGKPGAGAKALDGQCGVEEKINYLLDAGEDGVGVNIPTCSGSNVIQEGHHSMVALTVIMLKKYSSEAFLPPDPSGGCMFVSQNYVQIIDGNNVYKYDVATHTLGPATHYANVNEALRMAHNA